jgi:hypothetical protein
MFIFIALGYNKRVITNIVIAEPEGSKPLIIMPAIGHDPEPLLSTYDPQNSSPYNLS